MQKKSSPDPRPRIPLEADGIQVNFCKNPLNFDSTLDAVVVEADAEQISDCDIPYPFRKYARAWLEFDYEKAVKNASNSPYSSDGTLNGEVQATYREAMDRKDVEDV